MNLYYITTKKAFLDNIHCFHPILGAHYMDAGNDKVLVSAHFLSHNGIEQWEFAHDVTALPHPQLEGHKPLSGDAVNALQSLGIKPGHTVLDVAGIISRINPLMKLRAF